MGTFIFAGSWFWFIIYTTIWLTTLVYTKNKGYLFKDAKLNSIANKVLPFIFSLWLVLIIISNFQYTSKSTVSDIRGFDNITETTYDDEIKTNSHLVTSIDEEHKFYKTIENAKKENQQ